MSNQEAMTKYIGAFVDELAKSGVQKVVVSPGSRSTPIAMLLADHPEIEVIIHIDERSAAYFALGLAKAMNNTVAILCTSGTAAANYFPAVVESYYARVPLLVITADRPHELRDIGAAQTINQVDLYGKHVKWFQDMPLPESSIDMLMFVRTVCSRAVQTTMQRPYGPVHLNFPLREPLVPNMDDPNKFEGTDSSNVKIMTSYPTLKDKSFNELVDKLPKKGLIVCGPMDVYNPAFNEAIVQFAENVNYPIIADPLSQLRSGTHNKELILDSYNAFLKNETARKKLKPEMIIRFGSMPVSKSLMFYLKEHADVPQYIVDGGQGWRDPVSSAYEMIYCDEQIFCEKLASLTNNKTRFNSTWTDQWLRLNQLVKESIVQIDDEGISEGRLIYHLQHLLPKKASVMIGNSMPIRDMDDFFHSNSSEIKLFGNRGVNGIDGLISTALGISVIEDHTYLVVGDLSFYHDMNGLLAAKMHDLNLTILIINNNGGGIFSMLQQANYPTYFELLFGTPTDLRFEHAAHLYGGKYYKVETLQQYLSVMEHTRMEKGLKIIEVLTNRQENAEIRQKLWNNVSREIENIFG